MNPVRSNSSMISTNTFYISDKKPISIKVSDLRLSKDNLLLTG